MKSNFYWAPIGAFFIVLFLIGGIYLIDRLEVSPGESIGLATPAKEVVDAQIKQVESAPLNVYVDTVKNKLRLPEEIKRNPNKHVASAVKVKPDNRPHTIITTVDTSTGEFSTHDRIDPVPWISARATTHISAYYGIKNSDSVVRVGLQQELISIKTLNVEAVATTDIGAGKPDTFIGIGARLSF